MATDIYACCALCDTLNRVSSPCVAAVYETSSGMCFPKARSTTNATVPSNISDVAMLNSGPMNRGSSTSSAMKSARMARCLWSF